jgi:hypothetical protein
LDVDGVRAYAVLMVWLYKLSWRWFEQKAASFESCRSSKFTYLAFICMSKGCCFLAAGLAALLVTMLSTHMHIQQLTMHAPMLMQLLLVALLTAH